MDCVSCGGILPPAISKPRKFCNPVCRERHYRKTIREEGRNEWYSPQEIVEAARRVMGGIDLDPASCRQANNIVRATRYYTRRDDGLAQPWRGRVWLNPPYDTLAPRFFKKFCAEYEAGNVPTACLLLGTHHLTTRWFQEAKEFSALVCLPAGRLKFTGRLNKGNPPMHGSAILGVGVDPHAFRQTFNVFGTVLDAAFSRS